LATCSVAPSAVTPDGTNAATATVTITTTNVNCSRISPWGLPGSSPAHPGPTSSTRWLALWLLVLTTLAGFRAVRWHLARRIAFPLSAVLLTVLIWASCGGGGGGNPPPPCQPGTPAGTYTLTVTGTVSTGSGNLSHDITLTLKVN
jgi:hypothetical protein